MNFSQIQIAVVIVGIVSLVGVVISFFRKSAAYANYEDYKADIAKIVSALKAELFRDGDDLAISGNHNHLPLQVRFSYSETTPGLNIRLQAPVSFTFSVVPKGERATEGRVLIRTGDDTFDSRFACRTDHPTQAKMLIGSKVMRAQLEKLCCSKKTFLTLKSGSIELSELVIPTPYTDQHVLDHVASMGALAKAVEEIPGAHAIKIAPYQREKSAPYVRIAIAAGIVAAIIAVFILKPTAAQPDLTGMQGNINYAEGVSSVDALQIGDLHQWHAAKESDYAPEAAGWLKDYGIERSGHITLDLDGNDTGDTVYWLANDKGIGRIIFILNGANIYDTHYSNVVGAARVPKASLDQIQWKLKPMYPSQGDALLILVREAEGINPIILYPVNGRVIAGNPARYERINLQ